MRLYALQVRETRIRTQTVPATSAQAARRMTMAAHPDVTILSVEEANPEIRTDDAVTDATRALWHLFNHPYLDLDADVTATLGDWVQRLIEALTTDKHDDAQVLNGLLAPAGIRGYKRQACGPGVTLWIANSPSIAFLRACYAGTSWANHWGKALGQLPGAEQSNMTFRGQRSRSTGINVEMVLALLKSGDAA